MRLCLISFKCLLLARWLPATCLPWNRYTGTFTHADTQTGAHSFSSTLHPKHPISGHTWPPASHQNRVTLSMVAGYEQIRMRMGGRRWWIEWRVTACVCRWQMGSLHLNLCVSSTVSGGCNWMLRTGYTKHTQTVPIRTPIILIKGCM